MEGWLGTVHGLPLNSPYDDYFVAQEPAGSYGLASPLAAIEAQLRMYRDSGTLLRVWGILDYGVDDYNKTQLQVTRLEPAEAR
ncbi:MAG: hypothetical protein H5T69_06005 [Chloroflexi bacterium]|nr:hypothetical protein [Chloroflexota bacterium]